MGIPKLLGSLEPYASRITFNPSPGNDYNPQKRAVIDGPGLAYHVFYQTLARRVTSANNVRDVPSYAEIGDAILDWLDAVEAHAIPMYVLLFTFEN